VEGSAGEVEGLDGIEVFAGDVAEIRGQHADYAESHRGLLYIYLKQLLKIRDNDPAARVSLAEWGGRG